MQRVAQATYIELRKHFSDEMINAIGYFHGETQEFIYISDELERRYDESALDDILEDAFFDTFGASYHEDLYDSELHATTRIYDEYIDTVIPLGDTRGVLFIIDCNAWYQFPEAVKEIKDAVTRY